MARRTNKPRGKSVEALTHEEATRKNIPTAEYQSVMQKEEQSPVRVAYERRNRDLDPQLVWRGKDEQDWSDLVVHAPPLYIQEKVHPKVLIDDLLKRTRADDKSTEDQVDLFADFNGLPDDSAKTEFYQHDANWTNRMILGDSLQVMASLAEREGLRGQVQCIYLDPPYGIKFNSNFQWSTTSRDVKDGNVDHITREPEQVKAFRDTWRDGVHSYLTYLRDRLTVARDLLSDSGSIFVQIGDENVHRVRTLLDEVFGDTNFCAQISIRKTSGLSNTFLPGTQDFLLWYAKKREQVKYRQLYRDKLEEAATDSHYSRDSDGRLFRLSDLTGPFSNTPSCIYSFEFRGKEYQPSRGRQWKTTKPGMTNLSMADRIASSLRMIYYRRLAEDFPVRLIDDTWHDISGSVQSRNDPKVYVVQTGAPIVQRCLLMATDPGDLVLDPTCGAGTTAYVAEQWGRRWITIDTSRVSLALSRARIMGTRYPYYLLLDSPEGQKKIAAINSAGPSSKSTRGDVRQGFVNMRVPRITLESFSKNAEIGVIWEKHEEVLSSLLKKFNATLKKDWQDWEVPSDVGEEWPVEAKQIHNKWSARRIARQKEIDASIAAKTEFEYLYDKPYEDKSVVRVAGPFTVESLSPHRVLGVDENDELIDSVADRHTGYSDEMDFVRMVLENLKTAGVQQAHKEDKITFRSLTPWPGDLICAEGRYIEGGVVDDEVTAGPEKRAAIFIGPEFGTVSRPDLVAAAREAGDADFDVLVACAFNYDAHSSEFDKLGRIPVLKARMNADLHMADDLKNTGKGNLFVIFGEPDIDILQAEDDHVQVKVNGVDVFHPQTGEVRSDGPEGIACWFIDTDYNEESFFVRHAYFLGANDPYKALKTTLKAEINEDAWATLHSDTSRPFSKPKSGRIAVKVINHLGDEVMKVFRV
ncbi:MAG: site-specific DNA-methyltransferase [Burkholderiaceae bacterium]|nr:site-specific DNA-methyltransferase [Burkholderiaceae bacterium]